MAQVDFAERQLTLKLVYYGPPLSREDEQPARAPRQGRQAQSRPADDARHARRPHAVLRPAADLLPRRRASRSGSRSTRCPASRCTRRRARSCSRGPTASCSSPTRGRDQREANRRVVAEPVRQPRDRSGSTRSRSSSSTTSATCRTRCRSTEADRFGDPERDARARPARRRVRAWSRRSSSWSGGHGSPSTWT